MGECAVWGGSRQSVRKSSGSSGNTSSESRHRTGHDRISSGSFKSLQTARAVVSFGLLVFSVVVLFQWADGTRVLFVPLTGTPAILPALFTFWIAGRALSQVAKAGRLPQFFGFQDTPKIFIFTGAFTLCRHPMYAGWLIASWGLDLSKPFLLTVFYNLLLTAFVVFLAFQEERRMIEIFGGKYRAYRRQIPFLLPYGFLKKQIRNAGAPRI
jgi:protein-S-isoprenylcysteine O-methyltransferase Ste14